MTTHAEGVDLNECLSVERDSLHIEDEGNTGQFSSLPSVALSFWKEVMPIGD
jgi:hypothetical protein